MAASFVVPADDVLIRSSEAIILGTVQSTRVERDRSGGIQTVATVTVEDVLRGNVRGATIEIAEKGGVDATMALVLSGMPNYEEGARVLAMLWKDRDGQWTTKDLVLGKFELAVTAAGERVWIREEGDIAGWDPAGNVYAASNLRSADEFVSYVRSISRGEPVAPSYFIDGSRNAPVNQLRLEGEGLVAGTAVVVPSQYLLKLNFSGTIRGMRYANDGATVTDSTGGTFIEAACSTTLPDMNAGLTWYIKAGSPQPGLADGGVAAFQAALAAWNGDCGSAVNYPYGGTTAAAVGLGGACSFSCPGGLSGVGCGDGVNGIIFNDPNNEITGTFGLNTTVLGRGGSVAFSFRHPANGEFYWTSMEGNVVINDGVGGWSGLGDSRFTEVLIHEVGHALGFRHSDRNDADAACEPATDPCSNAAIMTASVSGPYGAALQQWDKDAVRAVYPGGVCGGTKGDLNADGKADLIWRSSLSGQNSFWFIDTGAVIGGGFLNPVPDTLWTLGGTGDFNNDGKTDLLWHHDTLALNTVWFMDGTGYVSQVGIAGAPAQWKNGGVGDFNGDGNDDIAWRNSLTGENSIWFMTGTNVTGGGNTTSIVDLQWKMVGAGDVNGDGRDDLLLWHAGAGSVVVWFMNGLTPTGAFIGQVADTNWRVAAVGDFNGDGKADITWKHTGGSVAVWYLDGASVLGGGFVGLVADTQWDVVGAR